MQTYFSLTKDNAYQLHVRCLLNDPVTLLHQFQLRSIVQCNNPD